MKTAQLATKFFFFKDALNARDDDMRHDITLRIQMRVKKGQKQQQR